MKRFGFLLACFAFLWRPETAVPADVVWPEGLALAQGEIVEVRVAGSEVLSVEGQMNSQAIAFFRDHTGSFTALVGADLEAKPGPVKLILKAATGEGQVQKKDVVLRIRSKAFPKESFTVSAEFDQLSDEVLERIRRERDQFSRAFSTSSRKRLWDGVFIEPLAGEISSPFGLRRVINGALRSPHTGADLRALMGTPVLAANHGRVVLRGDFFYSGKSLVLDHGGGLYTMYFHLSEFYAEEQALVHKGDVIALSGMSGRVTGPHLHWGARINNARVDPFQLLAKISAPGPTTQEAKTLVDKTEK